MSDVMFNKLVGIEPSADANVDTNLGLTANDTSFTITSSTGTNVDLTLAAADKWGLMSDVMFNKLVGIEDSADANVDTNLGLTANDTSFTISSSTGTNVDLTLAAADKWGLMSDEMFTKLAGIEDSADANVATNLGLTANDTSFTISSSTGTNVDLTLAAADKWGLMSDDMFTKLDSAIITDFSGDSGSGGSRGLVPAPAIGDAGKFLKGDGTWGTVSGGGGGGGLPSGLDYSNNIFAVSGSITATGDITAYLGSDIRYKENLKKISEPNEKIKRISGYEFDWNEKHEIHKNTHDVGVIAQEIEEILPEIVTERDDGYKAVRYEKIVPLLIESNKDLINRVEELETTIKEKDKKYEELEERMKKMEELIYQINKK